MTRRSAGRLEARNLSLDGSVIEILVHGRLVKEDNAELLPQLEAAIDANGSIRLLLRLEGFTGMDVGAVIEDIKFDFRHFGDLQRIAVVGDRLWEQWATRIGALLLAGDVRYFDLSELTEAQRWILAGGAPNLDPVIDTPLTST